MKFQKKLVLIAARLLDNTKYVVYTYYGEKHFRVVFSCFPDCITTISLLPNEPDIIAPPIGLC